LGYEDTINRGDQPNELGDYLPFIEVGTGLQTMDIRGQYISSCLLLSNDDMKCFGTNDHGQVGNYSYDCNFDLMPSFYIFHLIFLNSLVMEM